MLHYRTQSGRQEFKKKDFFFFYFSADKMEVLEYRYHACPQINKEQTVFTKITQRFDKWQLIQMSY